MAWNDRIRESAYTSPSGVRTKFVYEDVSKTVDKKTTGFEFPDAEGTLVQDFGRSGRRYPLRVFFWGADYDQQSEAFESSLLEKGPGKLEHPVYGVVDVVPFGTISRRDDLKTKANQTIIEVTFWETISVIYPVEQSDPASAILNSVIEYNIAASIDFERGTSLNSAIEVSSFKNDYNISLGLASEGLKLIAASEPDVQKQFENAINSITGGLDILASNPATLTEQTAVALQIPAKAEASIQSRLEAYRILSGDITSTDYQIGSLGSDSRNVNDFYIKDIYASIYVTGSVLSVVNTQFTTKSEALKAADDVLTQLEDIVNWRDRNFRELGEVDTGGAYQKLQDSVALTAGFLVQISFTLKQERSIVLNRNRTIIDLSAELYGCVDDKLDFIISSNNLSGSEILEIPRGREIVYYV